MALAKRTIIALAVWVARRRRNRRRKIRSYVRGMNLRRLIDGEFQKVVMPLRTLYPEEHFSYFRMTRERFDDLLLKVEPYLSHPPTHRMPFTPMHRLAITIRYLAIGGSLSGIMYGYRVGKTTLANIIRETTKAIWLALNQTSLKPPDRSEWERISDEFWKKWNFPLCLGAIDGKHIAIKCPKNSASLYYNYKSFFSIVLMAVVDADYRFVFIDLGGYGSEGDAGLFNRSSLARRLAKATEPYERGGLEFPYDNALPGTAAFMPHVFLGDQAFALQRHLMRPYFRRTAGRSEEIYNYRLSRARRVVENAFGILTTRWRILESRIDMDVSAVEDIVKACIVLHNYLKANDIEDHHGEGRYAPDHYVDYENADGDLILGDWRDNADHTYPLNSLMPFEETTRSHYTIRDRFKAFFSSDVGTIPWQVDAVKRGKY